MNAFITLTDSNGVARTGWTSTFSYYRFNDVSAGETYIIAVSSKRFSFAPQTVNVMREIENLNLIALQ